jgi:membrane-associated phospholipid phosphatase
MVNLMRIAASFSPRYHRQMMAWHSLRARLVTSVCALIALAVMGLADPGTVHAQGLLRSAGPLDANAFASAGLFADREARDPFDNLFVADNDLAADANGLEWLTIAPETIPDPMLAAVRQGVQVQVQKPDEATHTGFKALVVETGRDFNSYPRRHSTWVILMIGGAAAAIAHPFDDQVNDKLAGSDAAGKFFAAGKYIGAAYTQLGVATGLYVIGRYMLPHAEGAPKTNKVSHLGFDLLRALVVSQALTQGIKVAVRRDRPTGECCAFPSGHASASFATASVLERHLGYRGAWPTFAIATYVAMSRLHDNRHFLSDVIFGGAVGVSSGWTVVGRHGRSTFALTPVPLRGGMMVAVTRKVPQPSPAAERP